MSAPVYTRDPILVFLDLPREEQIARLAKLMSNYDRMKAALEGIANYLDPEDANNEAIGLEPSEWIEMAYENVIHTAQFTLRNLEDAG